MRNQTHPGILEGLPSIKSDPAAGVARLKATVEELEAGFGGGGGDEGGESARVSRTKKGESSYVRVQKK